MTATRTAKKPKAPPPAKTAAPEQPGWPAEKIVRRRASVLVPYARNSRTHSEEQVGQIMAAIREWGWTTPILIDENDGVIAGHARLLAAQRLGIAEVPTIVAKGWSEAQKRAYVIADNQLALNAGWDADMLKVELNDLMGLDFDLDLLGFGERDLTEYLADRTGGLTDPDAIPDAPSEPVTLPGDLWLLGNHRLKCGDATKEADVAEALGKVSPLLMVTDPPYGVDYDPTWRVGLHRTKRDGKPLDRPAYAATGDVQNDDRADWSEAWALFPGDVAYVWHGGLHGIMVADSLHDAGFVLRAQVIWRKPHFALGRGDYHWQHEPCWYAVRKNAKAHWNGARDRTTVWDITSAVGFTTKKTGPDARTGHSTQKPVECMKRPIENNSSPGQAVYDPFVGSGTTLIAAEMAGRSCLALELDPVYVDIALLRWQAFTGKQARLDATGETFTDTAAARGKAAS